MRDKELYRHLLGLSAPWVVAHVELKVAEQQVDVFVEHQERSAWPCPQCGVDAPLYDHDEERCWRHLDSCHFRTVLHGRVPRVRCARDGVRQVRVPWAEPRSRFTLLFERLAIDVLLETDLEAGSRLLGLSWDEAQGIRVRRVTVSWMSISLGAAAGHPSPQAANEIWNVFWPLASNQACLRPFNHASLV